MPMRLQRSQRQQWLWLATSLLTEYSSSLLSRFMLLALEAIDGMLLSSWSMICKRRSVKDPKIWFVYIKSGPIINSMDGHVPTIFLIAQLLCPRSSFISSWLALSEDNWRYVMNFDNISVAVVPEKEQKRMVIKYGKIIRPIKSLH